MTDRIKHGTTITLPPGLVVTHSGFRHDKAEMESILERVEEEREVKVDFHWILRDEIDIICSCDMTRTGNRSRCTFRDTLERT